MIPKFIEKQFKEKKFTGEMTAGVMFVDISGFTNMTQKLMEKGKEGVEVLTDAMNFIFSPSIKSIIQNKGFVSSFAGDAFTAIFPMDFSDIDSFLQSAFKINHIFKQKKKFKSDFTSFEIKVKISLSYGIVNWHIIRGSNLYTYFFDGEAISDVAQSEKFSQADKIICSEKLFDKIKDKARYDKIKDDLYELIDLSVKNKRKKEVKIFKSSRQILSEFVPEEILNMRETGEFRKVITCFISIKKDKHFIDTISQIMKIADFYKGYFNKIDFGDKGYVILVVFGAPIIPDNVFKRAAEFAIKIRNLKKADKKIGMSFGVTYSGFIGSQHRREYTSIGMAVNMAARLMIEARWNSILTEKNLMENLVKDYEFIFDGNRLLKGFEKPIPTYSLVKKLKTEKKAKKFVFIDREKEIEEIKTIVKRVFRKKRAEILYISGREGVGKSTLINYAKEKIKGKAWRVLSCDSIVQKAFNPFKNDLKDFFSISDDRSLQENLIEFNIKFDELENRLQNNLNELENPKDIRKIIGYFLGLGFSDIENLPQEILHKKIVLYLSLLYSLFLQNAVFVLEDSDYIDEESLQVLNRLVGYCEFQTTLFVFVFSEKKPKFKSYIKENELLVTPFGKKDLHNLIVGLLKNSGLDVKYVPKKTLDLIYEKTEGVPLFVEQTVSYLSENNLLDNKADISVKEFDIPSDISLMIISKIDKFDPEFKKITKVASVLGRKFSDTLLSDIVKEKNLQKYILNGEKEDIWQSLSRLDHIFKSSLIRDSVYELILKKELQKLHNSVAKTIKKMYSDNQEEFFPEIAYNYLKAKKLYYAAQFYKKAANYALKRYELSDAVKYLKELYKLDKKTKTLFKLIEVLILKGNSADIKRYLDKISPENLDFKEKEQYYLLKIKYLVLLQKYNELEDYIRSILNKIARKRIKNAILIYLLDALRALNKNEEFIKQAKKLEQNFPKDSLNYAKLVNNVGIYYLEKAEYGKAESYFKKYLKISEKKNDKIAQMKAMHNIGIIHSRKGDRKTALEIFTKTLELSIKLGDEVTSVKLLSDIAAIYSINNEVSKAIKLYKKAIKLNKGLQNRFQQGILFYNLAEAYFRLEDFDSAISNLNKSIEICKSINDKTGITFAYDLMGDILFTLGKYDEAHKIYLKNLKIQKEINETEGIAHTYGNLGNLFKVKKMYKQAEKYYKKQISILSKVGDKEGEGKAWFNWAMVEVERKNYESAKTKLEKAIDLFDKCSFKYGYDLAKEQYEKLKKDGA